jgi:hypothetical protein
MPSYQQPNRRPPTPDQIVSQQKADAARQKREREQQGSLPEILKAAVPAAPDNRTAAERLADTVAPSFMPGPPFRFNGKDGRFEKPGSDEPLDETTRYAALVHEMWSGRIKFNGEGEQPTRDGGLPYNGYEMPPRESLGDLDPNEWPAGLDGKPTDPWLHQMLVPMQNLETSEVFTFQTTSATGRAAVGALMRAYNRMRVAHPGEVPIVQLKPSNYEHRTFGKVNIPAFVIVGRTNIDEPKPGTPPTNNDPDDGLPPW